MRSILFVASLVLAAGCSDASKQIEKLADQACACKDAACADKVIDDLIQFAKDNPRATGDEDKAVKAAQRLTECAMKAGVDPSKLMDKMKSLQDVK